MSTFNMKKALTKVGSVGGSFILSCQLYLYTPYGYLWALVVSERGYLIALEFLSQFLGSTKIKFYMKCKFG